MNSFRLKILFVMMFVTASVFAQDSNATSQKNQNLSRYSPTSTMLRQLFSFYKNMVTNRVEKENNAKVLNYYNDDNIDYTLIRGSDRVYTLHEGKNTLFRFTDESLARDFSKNAQQIRICPGKIVDKKKLESIVYAMPVMNGKQTKCDMKFANWHNKTDSVQIKNIFFRMNPGDTICAVRSGVACQDVINGMFLVYHEDGTIAIYSNINKFFKHGDRIIAGQPIGTLKEDKKSTRLTILYLDKDVFKNSLNPQLPYSSYSPIFRTDQGDIHIDGKLTLMPKTDDALRMQEMTSKEKKKFLKGK